MHDFRFPNLNSARNTRFAISLILTQSQAGPQSRDIVRRQMSEMTRGTEEAHLVRLTVIDTSNPRQKTALWDLEVRP